MVSQLREPAPSATEMAHALAEQLLDRHGVVTRESVLAEGVRGGFAAVYPVLKAMEEAGRVRRGYFVAGLGAAQFALPGAIDRLRSTREAGDVPVAQGSSPTARAPEILVLAAADPAQPYGAALAWPGSSGRPSRSAGAYVVLAGGSPAAFLERGARSLVTFAEAGVWIDGLVSLVKDGRIRKVELTRIDGMPAADSPHATALRDAGFVDGYRGLTLRA